MNSLASYVRQSPRTAGAVAFGSVTMIVQHFVWLPQARRSGLALSIAAGLAHAIAGAITGPRLMDSVRTRTPLQAGLLGARTSLFALLLFVPSFTVFLFATDLHPAGPLSYVLVPLLIAVFAFLGDGWALLIVSIGIGWALHRIVAYRSTI